MHKKLVDVRALIRSKYEGKVPDFVPALLERLIKQDDLNELMQLQDYVDGVDMANRLLSALDITVEVIGADRLPSIDERILFASNHPLGGADGIVLTAVLGGHYQKSLHVMVTDLLMQVWQMTDVFVPINKYGAQSRDGGSDLTRALESSAQILTFPSGEVSRKGDNGKVQDRAWRPSFAKLSKRYNRDIVPLYFEGSNSKFFYTVEKLRASLKLSVLFGTILLPREFLGAKGHHFRVFVGERIPVSDIPTGPEVKLFAERIRQEIYHYPERYKGESGYIFQPDTLVSGRR